MPHHDSRSSFIFQPILESLFGTVRFLLDTSSQLTKSVHPKTSLLTKHRFIHSLTVCVCTCTHNFHIRIISYTSLSHILQLDKCHSLTYNLIFKFTKQDSFTISIHYIIKTFNITLSIHIKHY